jgi:hypothetical protein
VDYIFVHIAATEQPNSVVLRRQNNKRKIQYVVVQILHTPSPVVEILQK